MGSLTGRQRRLLAGRRPDLFVERPTRARPEGGYPVDTPARARSAHARAVQHHGAGSALDKRVERKVHQTYPEMKLHYHGVHACRGGAEHARLLRAEGPHGERTGEVMIEGVQMGRGGGEQLWSRL